jgi:hypothetical protein
MYKIYIRCAAIASNVIPLINYIPQYEASGGMYIQFHAFLTWAVKRRVVSFTNCKYISHCLLNRRLGGLYGWPGHWRGENIFPLLQISPRFLSCSAHSLLNIFIIGPSSVIVNVRGKWTFTQSYKGKCRLGVRLEWRKK